MSTKRRAFFRFTIPAILAALVLCDRGGAAHADDFDGPKAAMARSLFDDGMRLMEAGRYADACPKLAESNRLDAGMGVQYRLAVCYENTLRLASAWALFTQVADAAATAKMAEREKVARAKAEALRLRLPRMIVLVPQDLASIEGLQITRDGDLLRPALFGTSIPVDAGEHKISVSAPGRRRWETTAQASESATITVTIPSLNAEPIVGPFASGSATGGAAAGPAPANTWGGRHTAGLVIAGVGLVGIGIGAGLGADTLGKHSASKAACPDRTACSSSAIDLENAAKGSATGSTIALIAGGVALAGGAVLFLTAGWPSSSTASPGDKSSATTLKLKTTAQGAMMTIEGGF